MDKRPAFEEFTEVSLVRPVAIHGISMPMGARGTVMAVYADQMAYEVEFEDPRHVVLTLEEGDIRR